MTHVQVREPPKLTSCFLEHLEAAWKANGGERPREAQTQDTSQHGPVRPRQRSAGRQDAHLPLPATLLATHAAKTEEKRTLIIPLFRKAIGTAFSLISVEPSPAKKLRYLEKNL